MCLSCDLSGPRGLLVRRLRDLQDLSRLDFVGIGQLVTVRVENLLVGVGIAQQFLGDFAQRIARLHRVCRLCDDPGCLDVGDDLVWPVRNRLDGVPNLVCLLLGIDGRVLRLRLSY
jgi:hypothetical protein